MKNDKPQLDISSNSELFPHNHQPFIIAGPCSAETEEQVLQTARQVSRIPQVSIFRAGIWKPRTRPNSFEGIGAKGLRWLKRVKEETALRTAVEVANATHVYEALKFGVDVLWLGARTTVNPFSVQEIADALRGADIPVWVKNPINPDLQLWIGALERLNQAGIKGLGAIHRGFSTSEKTLYRNAPKWGIPIELKRLAPEIPLICDPSHITGNAVYLQEVAQKALDLAMNGLMIETHINPGKALSDAAQQIEPITLKKLLDNLQFRRSNGEGLESRDMLELLRQEVDSLDYQLLELILQRTEISTRIGQFKKEHNMTIYQVKRWEYLLEDRLNYARKLGLEEEFIKNIYQNLHYFSIKIQEGIMNPKQPEVKS